MAKVFQPSDWPARRCTGPCDQGRRDCPCPAACETDEPERPPMTRADFWVVTGVTAALWCAILVGLVVWRSA